MCENVLFFQNGVGGGGGGGGDIALLPSPSPAMKKKILHNSACVLI